MLCFNIFDDDFRERSKTEKNPLCFESNLGVALKALKNYAFTQIK